MDKGIFKELMAAHQIPQTTFTIIDFSILSEQDIEKTLISLPSNFSLPLYVKPANSGSSVGITRVEKWEELHQAISAAKEYDIKVIIEEGCISPKEIEIGVIGNEKLLISAPGELILAKEFYDYDDKYTHGQAKTQLPADVNL
jgi:D-alanine-D-alanine ligase